MQRYLLWKGETARSTVVAVNNNESDKANADQVVNRVD